MLLEHPFLGCLSGAVGCIDVWYSARRSCRGCGLNLARGKILTASIGSVDLQYPSVFIYCVNLHQFLILCSTKAMMFVKLYFHTSDIYLISLVSLDPSDVHLRTKWMGCIKTGPIYDMYNISHRQYQCYLNIRFWGCLSGLVGSVDVWCSARQSCRGRGSESRYIYIYSESTEPIYAVNILPLVRFEPTTSTIPPIYCPT